jgi:hypothetical protein
MTAAKLFETGCCLCGTTESYCCPRADGEHRGALLCDSCRKEHRTSDHSVRFRLVDAEITRRKSPPAADRTWVPAVGEMCEGIPTAKSRFAGRGVVRGAFKHYAETRGERQAMLELSGGHCLVTRESLRPASRPSLPEAQFYGVQPGELPKRLAAGFTCRSSDRKYAYLSLNDALWDEDEHEYKGQVRGVDHKYLSNERASLPVHFIDWASTPRQATHPPAPERTTVARCGAHAEDGMGRCEKGEGHAGAHSEPSSPDPYKQVRDAHDAANRHAQTSDAARPSSTRKT